MFLKHLERCGENWGFWFSGWESFHKVADLTIQSTVVQVLPRSKWKTHIHVSDPVDSSTKMKLLTRKMCFWNIWRGWVKIVDFDFRDQRTFTKLQISPLWALLCKFYHILSEKPTSTCPIRLIQVPKCRFYFVKGVFETFGEWLGENWDFDFRGKKIFTKL